MTLQRWMIRTFLFAFVLALIALTAFSFRRTIPFEIQSLLAKDNPARLAYEKDLKTFDDESLNWIVIEDPGAMSPKRIQLLGSEIQSFLEMVYGVDSIQGPQNAKYFSYSKEGLSLNPFLKDGKWTSGALNELTSPLWHNNLIRTDQRAFLMSFKLIPQLPRSQEKDLFQRVFLKLNEIEKREPGMRTGVLGAKAASAHFFNEMQFQQRVITPVLLLVIIGFFFFAFRSWQIVGWSLFVIFICYTTTLCFILFVEGGLGPYSTFALMFAVIVATTDLIHFFGRLQEIEGPIQERLRQAFEISWLPCLLTSLTTAAGFLALIANQNLPVRYFGLYCAFACMIEWVFIFYFLPWIFSAFQFCPRQSPFDSGAVAEGFHQILERHARPILLGSLFFLVAGSYFTTQLHIDDNFYTKFEETHPLTRAVELFADQFEFVGSVSVIITPKTLEADPFSAQQVGRLQEIETELSQNQKISRLSSFSQIYENLADKVGKISGANSGETQASLIQILHNYGALQDYYNESARQYRVTLFLRSLATDDLNSVLETINQVASHHQDRFSIHASGFSVIRSYINGRVIQDFFASFFISFALIFLCYLWLYRNIQWSFLALIPNVLPLVVVSGAMGFFHIPVDTNLVILICVAFGISGDNTVHLTYVLQQEMQRGLNYKEALAKAVRLIGVAIVATSGVFVVCLPVFLLGHLRLFSHIAIFLNLAFVFAFLADAFMFPALQKYFSWRPAPPVLHLRQAKNTSLDHRAAKICSVIKDPAKPNELAIRDVPPLEL